VIPHIGFRDERHTSQFPFRFRSCLPPTFLHSTKSPPKRAIGCPRTRHFLFEQHPRCLSHFSLLNVGRKSEHVQLTPEYSSWRGSPICIPNPTTCVCKVDVRGQAIEHNISTYIDDMLTVRLVSSPIDPVPPRFGFLSLCAIIAWLSLTLHCA
jgi:hypothetical protein